MFNKDVGVAFIFYFSLQISIYYCQLVNTTNAHSRFGTTSNILLGQELRELGLGVTFSGCLPSLSSLREFKISQEQLFFSFILFDNLFSLAFLTINTP